ncbi:MAG: ABC transporter permease [Candidatus Thorarchaeota archaeon]
MEQNSTVRGIFLRLGPMRESLRHRSMKWWIGFGAVFVCAVALLIGLISLAALSKSGIGLQAVAGSLSFGIFLMLSTFLARRMKTKKWTERRLGIWLAAFIIVIMTDMMALLGLVFVPGEWIGFTVEVSTAGVILGIILLLYTHGYPILRERGSAGLITIAGFTIVLLIIYMTVISMWIVPYDPFYDINVGGILAPPSARFPLGTTDLGQDLLSRIIAGGAVMLQVAALSVAFCVAIGIPVGLLASYRGGIVDRLVSLVMDSLFAFPGLVLAIALAAMLGAGVVNMALAIAVVYIPSYFRVVRSQVLTVRELPYVEAAVVLGARNHEILLRYILPNVLPSAVVVMSINFADAILTAAGLTFVGLGLGIDVTDWGRDLTTGSQNLNVVRAWWFISFPGLMIIILALGFTLIGEGLSEILTPKLRE